MKNLQQENKKNEKGIFLLPRTIMGHCTSSNQYKSKMNNFIAIIFLSFFCSCCKNHYTNIVEALNHKGTKAKWR